MNEPTKQQWRELFDIVIQLELHKGDMLCAIREENKWDASLAYENLQDDLKNIRQWIKGWDGSTSYTTEKGDTK